MNYAVSNHPILSAKSKAMAADDFEQFKMNHLQAEILLGLDGQPYSNFKADTAKLAIALQINYQIESGLGHFMNKNGPAAVRGGSVYFRGDKGFPIIHPYAMELVNQLKSSDEGRFPVVTSLRGPRR